MGRKMERKLSWLLVVSMLAGFLLVPGMAQNVFAAQAGNLLNNPGFEASDLTGWKTNVSSSVSLSTDQKHEGSQSLKIADGTKDAGVWVWSNKVAVTAGKSYTVSMQVWDDAAVSGKTAVQMLVRFYAQQTDTSAVDSKQVNHNPTQEGKWELVEQTVTVPNNANYADVLIVTTKDTIGTVYVDSTSLAEYTAPPVDTSEPESTGSTGGSEPDPVDPSNIVNETFDATSINNTGFPAGWQGHATGAGSVQYFLDSSVRVGNTGSSVKMVKSATDGTRTMYIEKVFPVTPGKRYYAELDYLGDVKCQFYIQTIRSNGTPADYRDAGTTGKADTWTHLTNEIIATEAAAKIRVIIGIGGAQTGTVYFDNIKLIETDPIPEVEEVDPSVIRQENYNDAVLGSNGLPSGWTGDLAGAASSLADGNIYLQQTKDDGVQTTRTIYYEKAVSVKAGSTYRLEMDYYGGPNCQFYLQLLSGGKVVQWQDSGKLGKETAWIHLTNEIVAQQNAEKIRITIGLGGAVTGTVGFDNLRLVEITGSSETVIYSEDFESITQQANGFPKGWQGAENTDNRYKLVDTGKYLQLSRSKASDKPATMVLEMPVSVTSGKAYKAQIDFLGKARGIIQMDLLNGKTVVQTIKKSTLGDEHMWLALVTSLTAQANATAVRVTVSLETSAVGSFGFDNFKLIAIPEDTRDISTDIDNPSFEQAPTDKAPVPTWNTQSDMNYITVTTEQASNGTQSLKMVDEWTNVGLSIRSAQINVVPNAAYEVKVDCYGSASAQVLLAFMNKYGVSISNASATATKQDGFWFTMKAEGTAPADAAYAVVILATTMQTTGRVYFDNVRVEMTAAEGDGSGGSTPTVVPESGWKLVETSHPRLYFNKSELKEIKAFAKDKTVNVFGYSGAENYAELLEKAKFYVTEDSFRVNFLETRLVIYDLNAMRDPNTIEEMQTVPPGYNGLYYPYITTIASELQTRMQTLALAYAISGETKYADRAIHYAVNMASWELWAEKLHTLEGIGENSCLETAYYILGASTVYDMCYDRMSQSQRALVKNAIRTKGLDMIMEDTGILINHNYYLTRIGSLLTGACVIADSIEEIEEYLIRGYNYADWYLSNLYTSGDQEGFLYNSHQLDYLIEGMDHMARVTGNNDLIRHKYFSDLLIDWVIYFMAPGNGKLMPVSDSQFSHYFFKTMSVLNRETGNGKAGFYLKYSGAKGNAFSTLLYTSMKPVIADADSLYQAVVHIEELGYGGLRSGWDESDVFLSIISNSSSLHHNHWDQNSIILATDSNILVADAGYADTSGNASGVFGRYYGHTTILVDGEAQSEKATGSLSTIINSNLYGHLMGSAPGAYGEDKDGAILTQFDRHAIMINHGDRPYYVIFDELAAKNDRVYTWNMFTGGWNALEIEGQAAEVGQTVKGNKVSVSTPGGMLFAEFVSAAPLDISAVMYEGGGPNIHVSTPAAKAAEFMTILTKNYGDSANQEYSVVELLETDDVEYKSSSNDPVITKMVTVQSVPLYFFRGDEVGDYIIFPFVAEESGNFEIILKTCRTYGYGQYQIYIDDQPVGVYDGSWEKTELYYHSLGQMDITAGEHTLKLEAIGSSSRLGTMQISLSSIIFSSGKSLGSSPIYAEETYDTESVLGAKIYHSAYNSDIVAMNRGSGSFTAGKMISDAEHASIIGLMTNGYMEGFAATEATALVYNDVALLKAESPVTVAADFRGTALYTITTDKAQTVQLYGSTEIKGVLVDGKEVALAVEGNMASVQLSAGTHTVELKTAQSTKIEYLDDGTIITTITNQDDKILMQHFQYTDGTEIKYGEDGKILMRVYVDEDTFLLVKEELSEDGTFTTTYYDVLKNIDKVVIEYPDGRETIIDYQSDGSIVTTVKDAKGKTVEAIVQKADGSVTKAEYFDDRTVTTKYDPSGNVTSIVTVYKDGRRVETIYNDDGTVLTTTYAKGGKLQSILTEYPDGTSVLVEYLPDGTVRTTRYDKNGNIIEQYTANPDGTIDTNVEPPLITTSVWLWIGIGVAVLALGAGVVLFILFKRRKQATADQQLEQQTEEKPAEEISEEISENSDSE